MAAAYRREEKDEAGDAIRLRTLRGCALKSVSLAVLQTLKGVPTEVAGLSGTDSMPLAPLAAGRAPVSRRLDGR